jgi:hypothetical protein
MSDMIDLLPCPFCGADAKAQYLHDSLGNNDTSISNIGCKNGCVHQSGFRQSSIAIAAWNKRAALPPVPDAVEALVAETFTTQDERENVEPFVRRDPAVLAALPEVQALVAEAVAQERERIIARLELAAGVYLDRASDTIQTNPLSATPTGKPTEDQLAAYDYDNMQAMLDGAAAVALRQEITAIRAGGKP